MEFTDETWDGLLALLFSHDEESKPIGLLQLRNYPQAISVMECQTELTETHEGNHCRSITIVYEINGGNDERINVLLRTNTLIQAAGELAVHSVVRLNLHTIYDRTPTKTTMVRFSLEAASQEILAVADKISLMRLETAIPLLHAVVELGA